MYCLWEGFDLFTQHRYIWKAFSRECNTLYHADIFLKTKGTYFVDHYKQNLLELSHTHLNSTSACPRLFADMRRYTYGLISTLRTKVLCELKALIFVVLSMLVTVKDLSSSKTIVSYCFCLLTNIQCSAL